jgi:predicted MFS family arabinose efflux permease
VNSGAVGLIFTFTLYIQQVWAFNPLFAGLSFVLMGLASILAGQVAPRLIARTSSRTILVVGLLIQAVGTAVLVGLSATPSTLVVFLVGIAVAGFGHITSVVSFRSAAASGLPDQEQGLAAGLATTAQQVGTALGVTIFVAVSAAGSDGLRRLGVDPGQAQARGTHDTVIVGAALLAAAALVAVVTLPRASTEGPETQSPEAPAPGQAAGSRAESS